MVTGTELFLLFIIIIIIVVISVLNSISAFRITKISTYKTDDDLKRAHEFLTGSAVAGWLGLIIIVAILSSYLSKSDSKEMTTGITVFLVISIILIITTGVLSAVAAVNLDRSKAKKKELEETGARSMTNVSSILGILGGVLATAVIVIPYFRKSKSKSKLSDDDVEDEDDLGEAEELAVL